MGKDEFNSEQTGSRRIAQFLENFRSPLDNPRIAKIMELASSPIDPRIAKIMEQLQPPLEDPRIAKIREQFSSPLTDPHMANVMEQFRSPLTDPHMAKVMEQFGSPLMDSQLARFMEPYRALLRDDTIGKLMEQHRTALEHTQLGKLFQNSFFEARSALAGVSVEALLKELKNRRTDFADETDLDVERQSKIIEAEGRATASAKATGDARVEKTEAQHPPVKSQDLSSIPTWFIRFALHVMFRAIELIAQWEQIRVSVADLNARLPQSESPSKIRNFIRSELAGKPGDIRLVTGSDVNFRLDPNMKSEIILKLPKNAIVVVQGKEDRTWLLVSYEIEGYWIDGYVSTKFLKKVRKD